MISALIKLPHIIFKSDSPVKSSLSIEAMWFRGNRSILSDDSFESAPPASEVIPFVVRSLENRRSMKKNDATTDSSSIDDVTVDGDSSAKTGRVVRLFLPRSTVFTEDKDVHSITEINSIRFDLLKEQRHSTYNDSNLQINFGEILSR